MKQITFRQLQTNTKWLKDLPVEVIRYGKVVVVMDKPLPDKYRNAPIVKTGWEEEKKEKQLYGVTLKEDPSIPEGEIRCVPKDLKVKDVSQKATTPHHPSCKCDICKP